MLDEIIAYRYNFNETSSSGLSWICKICKSYLFVIRLGICTYDIICVICSHNGKMFTPSSSQIYFG